MKFSYAVVALGALSSVWALPTTYSEDDSCDATPECPAVSGDILINQYQLYPENLFYDTSNCKLLLGYVRTLSTPAFVFAQIQTLTLILLKRTLQCIRLRLRRCNFNGRVFHIREHHSGSTTSHLWCPKESRFRTVFSHHRRRRSIRYTRR